jgi:uncharacterized protein YggT (Ycf19 family)
MDARQLAELGFRLILLLRFVAFMAGCYLVLHILAARVCRPEGKILDFFQTLTGPLTRPIRGIAPALTEARARVAALGVVGAVWLFLAWLHAVVGRRLG